jgi:hypothetical protein
MNLVPRPLIDDEYQNAGIEDPNIFLTTSRDPSSRLIQFAKVLHSITQHAHSNHYSQEMSLIIPNTQVLLLQHVHWLKSVHSATIEEVI